MSLVRFTTEDAVARIVIDHPPHNVLTEEVMGDLGAAIDRLDPHTHRAVLLSGAGEVFSAGAEVGIFHGRTPDEVGDVLDGFLPLLDKLEAFPAPVVAAVHGVCQAGGFELALTADVIWAAEGTLVGLPEASIGIIPLARGVQRVADAVGPYRAAQLVFEARPLPAERLAAWGLVNRVVAADELDTKASAYARRLAGGPTAAHAATKELLRAWRRGGSSEADRRLVEIAKPVFATSDAATGIESYLTAGPGQAVFSGR